MVAAVRSSKGASRRLLQAALAGRFETLVSSPLLTEYEAVLKRPEHLRAGAASIRDIDVLLEALVAVGISVTRTFSWRPQMQDPNDEMVLETAIDGFANLIATFNLIHFRLPVACPPCAQQI
jgi:putative PIN family toxin of toxin-antitoxin system